MRVTAVMVLLAALFVPAAGAQENEPVPVISVTPNEGLIDGQRVTVRLAHFTPGAGAGTALCGAAVLESASIRDCDLRGSQLFPVGPGGRARRELQVFRALNTPNGEVDCTPRNACILGVATGDFPIQGDPPLGDLEAAWRYLRFSAEQPQGVTDVNLRGVDTTGAVVIVQCDGPGPVRIELSVTQGRGAVRRDGRARTDCAGRSFVRVLYDDWFGRLRNGAAEVVIRASAPGGGALFETGVYLNGDRYLDEPFSERVGDDLDLFVKRTRVVDDGRFEAVVHVACRNTDRVALHARLGQLVAGGTVEARGRTSLRCRGHQDVVVSFPSPTGFLAPGRATLRVVGRDASARSWASVGLPVQLDRLIAPRIWTTPTQPEGPARLGRLVSDAPVPVRVACTAESAIVGIEVYQRDRRELTLDGASAVGPCGQAILLLLDEPLRPGTAIVVVHSQSDAGESLQVFRRRVR